MIQFFIFLLWSQWLLLCDLLSRLYRGSFDCLSVESAIVSYLKIHIDSLKDSAILDKKTKIILSNHRSFTDFFLDSYLLGGAMHLSRYLIAFVLPVCGLYAYMSGRGIFFIRHKTSRQSLSKKIVNHLNTYTSQPLIVYPEGTRYLGNSPIPLKYGMIKTCYEYNLPCQILMSSGKEFIVNEKTQSLNFHRTCIYTLSNQIHPKNFSSFLEFYEEITKQWQLSWHKTDQEWQKRCSTQKYSVS
jgi:1-acyl-sn-glycerol-3-phosphate acyltransferase